MNVDWIAEASKAQAAMHNSHNGMEPIEDYPLDLTSTNFMDNIGENTPGDYPDGVLVGRDNLDFLFGDAPINPSLSFDMPYIYRDDALQQQTSGATYYSVSDFDNSTLDPTTTSQNYYQSDLDQNAAMPDPIDEMLLDPVLRADTPRAYEAPPLTLSLLNSLTYEPLNLYSSSTLECLRASNITMQTIAEPEDDNSSNDVPEIIVPSSSICQSTQVSSPPTSTHRLNHKHGIQKPGALRTTCEGCRKLKVKCKPSTIDGTCMKCSNKGLPCVFAPRASYGSKKATKK